MNDDDSKQIYIPLKKTETKKPGSGSRPRAQEKTIKINSRVWNLSDEQKTHAYQYSLLKHLKNKNSVSDSDVSRLCGEISKLLKIKRNSYKSQDILKNKYEINAFVSIDDMIRILFESKCVCLYCESSVFILYEYAYDGKQWTLDRIDNTRGHNRNNVVISCLECNLKRRLTNKDKFHYSKKIVLTKVVKENETVA